MTQCCLQVCRLLPLASAHLECQAFGYFLSRRTPPPWTPGGRKVGGWVWGRAPWGGVPCQGPGYGFLALPGMKRQFSFSFSKNAFRRLDFCPPFPGWVDGRTLRSTALKRSLAQMPGTFRVRAPWRASAATPRPLSDPRPAVTVDGELRVSTAPTWCWARVVQRPQFAEAFSKKQIF